MVKPIPDGYNSVTRYLVVDGAAKLIDFARQAFGAEEMFRMPAPQDTIGHAEIRIGDSVVMLADAGPENPPRPANLLLYVDDCDSTYRKALAAGVRWWIHTHVEDVSPEEMEKRAAVAMGG